MPYDEFDPDHGTISHIIEHLESGCCYRPRLEKMFGVDNTIKKFKAAWREHHKAVAIEGLEHDDFKPGIFRSADDEDIKLLKELKKAGDDAAHCQLRLFEIINLLRQMDDRDFSYEVDTLREACINLETAAGGFQAYNSEYGNYFPEDYSHSDEDD